MHKVVLEFYHDSLKSKETGANLKKSQFCQLGDKFKKMVVSCFSNELNANEIRGHQWRVPIHELRTVHSYLK